MTTLLQRAASVTTAACAVTFLVSPPTASGSPADERIVFSVPFTGAGATVGSVPPDGSAPAAIPVATELEDFNKSTWSHDGTQLLHSNAFVFDFPGVELAFRPAITDADGGNLRVLEMPTQPPDDMYCSAWSPDDSRILCSSAGNLLSVRASDGEGAIPLSQNPYGGSDLAVGYSPDGEQLAFLRSKPGPDKENRGNDQAEREALFVANADGSDARRVTDWGLLLNHELASANWSPDGSRVISVDRHGRVVEIAVEDSGVRTITLGLTGKYFAVTPDYSPDGTRIVVAVFRNAPAELYVANRNGSGAHPITDTPDTIEWFPDWR